MLFSFVLSLTHTYFLKLFLAQCQNTLYCNSYPHIKEKVTVMIDHALKRIYSTFINNDYKN